jgi:capsule polysaccharide export protein KpsE/RkpR
MSIRFTGARVALTLACVSGFMALAPRAEAQTTITVNDTTQGLTANCTIANAINTANAVTPTVAANISSIEQELSAANAVLQTDQGTLNQDNQDLQALELQVAKDDALVEQLEVQLLSITHILSNADGIATEHLG